MPRRTPCKTCPWRLEAHVRDIPNFKLLMAEGLASSCRSEPAIGDPIFACHQSKEGEEFVCAGWAAVYGHVSLSLRLSVLTGNTPADSMGPAEPDWPELHTSYDEMMFKMRTQFQEIDDE